MTVAFFAEFPGGYAHTGWALTEIERHFSRIRALDTNLACWWTSPSDGKDARRIDALEKLLEQQQAISARLAELVQLMRTGDK